MYKRCTLLLATTLALAGSAMAAPVTQLAPGSVSRAMEAARRPDESGLILVQNRGRGGGGGQRAAAGGQRGGGGANRSGNFNASNFNRDVSNSRNTNVNRNANVNANRNVNVSGGCCNNGNYDSGPNWGGVAAGVAVGAVVGAAATSAAQSTTYAAPPPTYPPGYVTPPPY